MKVVVTADCLQGRSDQTRHLPALFDQAARGLHDVLVHPDAEDEWLEWLEQRDPILRRVYQRAERDSQGRQALALVHNSTRSSQCPPTPRTQTEMIATESGRPSDSIRFSTSQATIASMF